MNVDIFACINVRAFPKIGNFAQINIYVFAIFASICHTKQVILPCTYFSRIFDKCE